MENEPSNGEIGLAEVSNQYENITKIQYFIVQIIFRLSRRLFQAENP
jgi:hypothetical protein